MTTYDLKEVQRVRFAVESTFGTDLTSDVGSNFYDIRHEPTQLQRATVTVPDGTVVQRAFQRRNDVLGPDRWQIQLMSQWVPTNEAITTAVTPTQIAQSRLLEALLGGYDADSGGVLQAGVTASGGDVAGGEGANFSAGQVAAIPLSGRVYPVIITSVSTDTLAWWPTLPSAPATSAIIYGSQTIYLTENPSNALQVLAEFKQQRGNLWLGRGGQGDLTLNLSRGDLAKWSTTIQGAVYDHDDEITTPQGGSSLAAASYDGAGPVIVSEGGCHFSPTGTPAFNAVRFSEVTVNFSRTWLEVGDHSQTDLDGMGQWHLNPRERITIELTLLQGAPYETYHDAFKAETDYGLLLWIDGGGAGKGLCLAAPTCQIAKAPEPAESFGLVGQKLTLLVKESSLSGATTTELETSPIVLGHY